MGSVVGRAALYAAARRDGAAARESYVLLLRSVAPRMAGSAFLADANGQRPARHWPR